ncbi:MAG: hypothetical protein KAX49_17660 [Halanaerobiales bacterium]|nr:hypothetical protein [Halanaerobiales bacterium]
MICPMCHSRFADFPKEDYIINEEGIITKNDEAHERRMEIFNSDEELFCSSECEDAFLDECETR